MRWPTGMDGEIDSKKSVLLTQLDDDDDDNVYEGHSADKVNFA